MQPTLTIPTVLVPLLPIIGSLASSYLRSDGLKPGINALIALAVLLVTGVLCLTLAGNWSGNWLISISAVLGYITLLMAGDLSVLRQWLFTSAPMPLAHKPAPARTSRITTAYVPRSQRPPAALQMPPREDDGPPTRPGA